MTVGISKIFMSMQRVNLLLSYSGINFVQIPLLIKGCVNVMENFEMWCWRRMEISRTDHVRNEEVLHIVEEERSILQTIKRR
jgi:hypothetical protein